MVFFDYENESFSTIIIKSSYCSGGTTITFLGFDGRNYEIKLHQLILIASEGNYTKIICTDRSGYNLYCFLERKSLVKWISETTKGSLIQINRGCIVNPAHILGIREYVTVTGGISIIIPKGKKKTLRKLYENYLMSKSLPHPLDI